MTAPMTPPDGIDVVPVRSPTLPPATHTNTWLLGRNHITVVDPASPWEDEQSRLFGVLAERIATGERVQRIFLTHHHHDHVSGAMDLQERLRGAGHDVPIAAHPVTASLLAGMVDVQEEILDGQTVHCGELQFVAHHTPGHAPGHLILVDERGVVVAGDLVAGVGTIAIDPSEGDLQDYLDSLAFAKSLRPAALLPAHGPILEQAEAVLDFYIAHRNSRSDQIRNLLKSAGEASALELVPTVYPDLAVPFRPVGAAQIETHLLWLQKQGLAFPASEGRWRHSD